MNAPAGGRSTRSGKAADDATIPPGPELVNVEHNTPGMNIYVFYYEDGSTQIRKPEGNEVARQHGIHTINLTAKETRALGRLLLRPLKR